MLLTGVVLLSVVLVVLSVVVSVVPVVDVVVSVVDCDSDVRLFVILSRGIVAEISQGGVVDVVGDTVNSVCSGIVTFCIVVGVDEIAVVCDSGMVVVCIVDG